MYPSDTDDTNNIIDEIAENTSLGSEDERIVVETIQRSALSHARESHRVEGEALASSSTSHTASPFLAKGRTFKAGTRKPGPGQRPPGDLESHLGDPASFALDRSVKGAFLSTTGHACIRKDSRWNGDAAVLWSQDSSQPWFWLNGRPFQMAKEAASIPFDQRSLAQRLAVREATRADALPLEDASAEPDVIRLASTNELPAYIRRDKDGRLNVYDITAWLFLTMTQPEHREGTVAWFWGTACMMFVMLGLFKKLSGCNEDTTPIFMPRRFVHQGEFTAKDVAIHFYKCGLTKRMASTVLRDFAKVYVERYPGAKEPNWATVPVPRERVARPRPAKQRRANKKRSQAKKRDAVLKTLAERIGESDTIARTFEVPAYDEPPPNGSPHDNDVEMANETGETEQDNTPADPLPFSPMGPA